MKNLIIAVISGVLFVASAPSFAVDQNDIELAKLNADYHVQLAREAEAIAEAAQARAEIAKARAEIAKAKAEAKAGK